MRKKCAFWLASAGASLIAVGCGIKATHEPEQDVSTVAETVSGFETNSRTKGSGRLTELGGRGGEVSVQDGPVEAPADQGVERRIIYEAVIHLVVSEFGEMEADVARLVKDHEGYLASVTIDRTTGEQRSGSWQARIPVEQFESFLEAVNGLGVPESRQQTARDVTEEFVDLKARIANNRRLEVRILKLLDESEGKIKDVIDVERELARVRGEIERMEGRLRYLANRTAFTTVTIMAREERDYVPPEAPSFLGRLRQAWGDSLLGLRNFGQGLTVAIVFAAPWIVLAAVVGVPLLLYLRRR